MAPAEPDTAERLNNFVVYLAEPGLPGRTCTEFTAPLLHRDAEDLSAIELRHITNLSFDRLCHVIGELAPSYASCSTFSWKDARTDKVMPLEDDDDLWAAIGVGCRMGIEHIVLEPTHSSLQVPFPGQTTASSSSAQQGSARRNEDDDLPSEDETETLQPISAFDDDANNTQDTSGLSKDDALDLEDRSALGQATKERLVAFQKFFGHAGEDWLSGDRQDHRCVRLKYFRKPLYQHQAFAVFWMAERLFGDRASGCVLGDQMGMGKTPESLALWVLHYVLREAQDAVAKARLEHSQAHLPADCPDLDATCPSKGSNSWGFQCPCEPGSLAAKWAKNMSLRPWLFLVPAGILKKIEGEFDDWVDGSSALKLLCGFTYAENKSMIFKNNVGRVLNDYQEQRSLARFAVLSSYQSFKTSVKRPLENAGLSKDDYPKFWGVVLIDEFHEHQSAQKGPAAVVQQLEHKQESLVLMSGTPYKNNKDSIRAWFNLLLHPNRDADHKERINQACEEYSRAFKAYMKTQTDHDNDRDAIRDRLRQANGQLTQALMPFMIRRLKTTPWSGYPCCPIPMPITKDIVLE